MHYGGSMPLLHVAASQPSDDQSGSLMNMSPQSIITLSNPNVKPVRVPLASGLGMIIHSTRN